MKEFTIVVDDKVVKDLEYILEHIKKDMPDCNDFNLKDVFYYCFSRGKNYVKYEYQRQNAFDNVSE